MLLAVDVGNSAIKFGLFEGDILHSKFSLRTIRDSTADQLKISVGTNLAFPVSAAIVCSVVPEIENALGELLFLEFGIEPVFVKNDFDFGLKISYEPPSALGTIAS